MNNQNFMTRGEARRLREQQNQQTKEVSSKDSDNPVTQSLQKVLIGLMAGKLGVEKVSFHHFDENGNVVDDEVINAIKS